MTDPAHETELKLALAPGDAPRVAAAAPLAGLVARRERFQAFYYDTAEGELARAGLGLRLRREGRHWRAGLKAAGESAAGLHRRPEWEFVAPGPQLDLARFAATPLAGLPGAATLHERLAPVLVTEFTRTRWLATPAPGVRIEVALDVGRLVARRREEPVCELEIELLEGPVAAAFDLAEALATDLAMRPEPASKLARGLALATARRAGPARAAPVSIAEAPGAIAAARQLVAACVAHAQANEAGVLAASEIEYVHQLRVALRRLRSALRLFRGVAGEEAFAALAGDLGWAAGVLGRCRDWDVFVTETLPPLLAAFGDEAAGEAVLRQARTRQREARRAAREALLSPRYGLAMIRVARWLSGAAPAADAAIPLAGHASTQLRKGARRLATPADDVGALDAAARHRLRIRVKRQRYAAELLGSLFRARAVARHVKALTRLQDALGRVNDGANALAHVRELSPPPALAEFARGWFAAREAEGLRATGRALRRVRRLKRFWRRKAKPRTPPEAG